MGHPVQCTSQNLEGISKENKNTLVSGVSPLRRIIVLCRTTIEAYNFTKPKPLNVFNSPLTSFFSLRRRCLVKYYNAKLHIQKLFLLELWSTSPPPPHPPSPPRSLQFKRSLLTLTLALSDPLSEF